MINIKIFLSEIWNYILFFCYCWFMKKLLFCFSQKFRNISNYQDNYTDFLFFLLYRKILKQNMYLYERSQVHFIVSNGMSPTQTNVSIFRTHAIAWMSWITIYSIARELSYSSTYIYVYRRWNGRREESVAGNQWHVVTLVDLTGKTV